MHERTEQLYQCIHIERMRDMHVAVFTGSDQERAQASRDYRERTQGHILAQQSPL